MLHKKKNCAKISDLYLELELGTDFPIDWHTVP